jgi:hypothetical protein
MSSSVFLGGLPGVSAADIPTPRGDPNSVQIGGSHYQAEYQHWDFVADLGLPYLTACASKYVTRYDKKNGKQDLLKAIHYLEKAIYRVNTDVMNVVIFEDSQSCTGNPDNGKERMHERIMLMAKFLEQTFKASCKSGSGGQLASMAVHAMCSPYVVVYGVRHYHLEDFNHSLRVELSHAISYIRQLLDMRYPEPGPEDPTPAYVNQDQVV